MNSWELTRASCRELGLLAEGLSHPDADRRAEAALAFADQLSAYGLSIEGLLHQRLTWGARPDLSKSCHALVRHFAEVTLPIGEQLGWNDEALEALEVFRDADVRQHPTDVLRILGMFAIAFGSVVDPDTPELSPPT